MTDLQGQTDQLLKALNTLHNDISQMHVTNMIVGGLVFAVLLVVALRRR